MKHPAYLVNKVGMNEDYPAFKNRMGGSPSLHGAKAIISSKGGFFTHYEILKHTSKGYVRVGVYENYVNLTKSKVLIRRVEEIK
jgi:hypothetical protein